MPRGRRHPGIGRPPISPTRRAKYYWREAAGKHRATARAHNTTPALKLLETMLPLFYSNLLLDLPMEARPLRPAPSPKT